VQQSARQVRVRPTDQGKIDNNSATYTSRKWLVWTLSMAAKVAEISRTGVNQPANGG
jgi:hypothetical protein